MIHTDDNDLLLPFIGELWWCAEEEEDVCLADIWICVAYAWSEAAADMVITLEHVEEPGTKIHIELTDLWQRWKRFPC